MEIQICLREQRLKLYGDDGKPLLDVPVKTGCSNTPTPTGTFKAKDWVKDPVNTKYSGEDPWRKDPWGNPYGPWFLPLQGAGGAGIHGTRGPRWLGNTLIRMPDCSHGCVRMSNSNIEKLHELLPEPRDTKVTIKESCE
jgi:lipoprotein-anchoring transpeptidase ErfK/SrfK